MGRLKFSLTYLDTIENEFVWEDHDFLYSLRHNSLGNLVINVSCLICITKACYVKPSSENLGLGGKMEFKV